MIKSPKSVIDRFDGMLSRDQAQALYSKAKFQDHFPTTLTAAQAAQLVSSGYEGLLTWLSNEKLEIKDTVYRIFNPSEHIFGESTSVSQMVVLGECGDTINLLLNKRSSGLLQKMKVERGDSIIFKKLILDLKNSALKSTRDTSISILAKSNTGIEDFSNINPSIYFIDIIGKIVEADPLIFVGDPLTAHKDASSKIKISDGRRVLRVICKGSSALSASKLEINRRIKIEFCRAFSKNGNVEIYAGELSRVLPLSKK